MAPLPVFKQKASPEGRRVVLSLPPVGTRRDRLAFPRMLAQAV